MSRGCTSYIHSLLYFIGMRIHKVSLSTPFLLLRRSRQFNEEEQAVQRGGAGSSTRRNRQLDGEELAVPRSRSDSSPIAPRKQYIIMYIGYLRCRNGLVAKMFCKKVTNYLREWMERCKFAAEKKKKVRK